METLERFRQYQRLIEDFTQQTLAALPGDLARLFYLASLRDLGSGRYHHEGLESQYGKEAVQQALAFCHEQLFCRLLEQPLEQLDLDLRRCLGSLEGDVGEIARHWQEMEPFRVAIPACLPDYLRELFVSNLRVLLRGLEAERTMREPVA
jgi:hypothetical protein